MRWYVMVNGPYDCVFVGPFDTANDAAAYALVNSAEKPQFDFNPMLEADMKANMAEHGDCPIQSPDSV